MKRYHSLPHFDFLNGNYTQLFEDCDPYPEPPTESEAIHVSRLADSCSCHVRRHTGTCTCNARYAVLSPIGGHFAEVVASNSNRLMPGMRVRIEGKWSHMRSTLDGSHQNTVGAPGMLEIPGQSRMKKGWRPAKMKRPIARSA